MQYLGDDIHADARADGLLLVKERSDGQRKSIFLDGLVLRELVAYIDDEFDITDLLKYFTP